MRKFQYDPMDSSRDKVMRGLGNKILPSSTGGPFLLNENRKKSLKRVYQELTGCLKEFKRELGIPLNNTEPYEWGEIAMDDISDILSDFPQFQLIFDETELPLLDQTPSVKDTSLKIIRKRLKKCNIHIPSPRSLENLLYGHVFRAKIANCLISSLEK